MSYYTKAKLWENINSNVNSMMNSVASLKQSFDYGKQYDMNKEFDNRYEEYQAVVDYADANAYTKYDSIDSFINSASSDLNIDSKFIKNVIESNNYDPTMSNGATMTSWMLQNKTGSDKWRRNQITKALNKSDESTIQNYILSGLETYAQELVSKDPYSMYDWEPSVKKKYSELLDPKSISEATGIDERRVQDVLNNSTIKENVDNIYDTKLHEYFDGLKEQQENARIKQAAGKYITSVIDQCVANNTSTEDFKKLLDESIVESGLNLTESPEILERYRYEAYESYIAKKSIEFGKENFLLDDYEFHEKFVEYNTELRKEFYGDSKKNSSYMNYADAYTSKINEATNKEKEDSAKIDEFKAQYYSSMAIFTEDVVNQIVENPYIVEAKDFSKDGIARMFGYESYQSLVETNDTTLFGYFDSIFNQVIQAKNTISSQKASLEQSAKEYNKQLKTQFEESFSMNCTNLIEEAKKNTNTIYSLDYIAMYCSNSQFKSFDELVDNGSWKVIDDFIKTCTEIAKISANNFSSKIDEQNTANYVKNRRDNLEGSSIKIANYSTSNYSVSIETGERTSKNDNKFALLNEDVVETNKTVVNPYYTFNPYQNLTDWTLIDELSKDDKFKNGLKVIDYDGFMEYLNTFNDENLKKDPYFVQSLIIQWNSAYTNIPTSEEQQEMIFDVQLNSANQNILNGNYTEGMQELDNLSATAPPDKIGEINTAISQAKTLIKNQTEFEQVNEIITNVIEGYKFGGDNKYYNILKSNATNNFNLSYRYAEELKNGTKTIEQVTEEIYSLFAQKNYDDSMKQLETNIKNFSGFIDFISGQDMNLFTSDFKLNYQKINEGTMYNMTDTEVKNFNSWLINQINGNEVKLEDINSTLFTISSGGNEKITYNGKEYKVNDKENPVYTKSLMIKGTLDYIAGKTKYLKDLLINVKGFKESDLQLINYKSDDGSYYDIALYDAKYGDIYLMPNDNYVNNLLCLTVKDSFKESIDVNLKGNNLITVSNYMTTGVNKPIDFSKYLSKQKDNIKFQIDNASRVISNINRPEINRYVDSYNKSTEEPKDVQLTGLEQVDKYRRYYGI